MARYAALREGAEFLGCSDRTVRRLVAAGYLQAFKVGKSMIRIDLDEVEALVMPLPADAMKYAR